MFSDLRPGQEHKHKFKNSCWPYPCPWDVSEGNWPKTQPILSRFGIIRVVVTRSYCTHNGWLTVISTSILAEFLDDHIMKPEDGYFQRIKRWKSSKYLHPTSFAYMNYKGERLRIREFPRPWSPRLTAFSDGTGWRWSRSIMFLFKRVQKDSKTRAWNMCMEFFIPHQVYE